MDSPGRTEWISLSGYRAAVHVHPASEPDAPVVLALHGFTGSALDFDPLREILRPGGLTWICPDFMGHGLSERARSTEPYQLVHALRLIDAARNLAPAGSRVHLLAYSMGGRIALHYLRWARPLPAILIGSSPGLDTESERRSRRRHDRKLVPLHSTIEDFCNAWESQPLIATQTRIPEPDRSHLMTRRRSNDLVALHNTLLACGTGSLPSLWEPLSGMPPLSLLYGETDEKFSAVARRMRDRNPAFKQVPVSSSGHAPHLENPGELARILDRILG